MQATALEDHLAPLASRHPTSRRVRRARQQRRARLASSDRLASAGASLRAAVEQQQLSLVYQPVVDLGGRSVVGAEALLRWNHPSGALLHPIDFLADAEETGLIVPIGCWVVAEACRRLSEWRRATGCDLSMAINVSPRQLEGRALRDTIAEAIDANGLPASALQVDLTENVLAENGEEHLRRVEVLERLGITLAIDDFGAGCSSLDLLSRLPVDIIKVDRTFVGGLGTHERCSAIIGAVVGLARSMGLRVDAKGVETADQAAGLRALGCRHAQGYLFAPPLERHAFDDLLATGDLGRFAGESLRFDDVVIDIPAREVFRGGARLTMTALELDLLVHLASSPRRCFSRDELLHEVWHSSSEWQTPSTVTEHIRRLRQKVELDPAHPRHLVTVAKVGYRFDP